MEKIQAILYAANSKTGKGDATLTDAVKELISGYGTGGDPVISPLSITENGTYTAASGVDGYSPVTVAVPTDEPIPVSRSGYTEFDITVSATTGLSVQCSMVGEKTWGDGTTDSLTDHTYSDYGDYTIVCKGTTVPAGTSSAGGVFGSTTTNTNRFVCTAARIGSNVESIGNYALFNSVSLSYVSIPDGVTIGTTAFRNCYSLSRVKLPETLDSLQGNTFYSCYALREIDFSGVTAINSGAVQQCYALQKVRLDSVESIAATAFNNCYGIVEYDFSGCNAVPTLANVSAFTGINGICRMIVPDALYNAWVSATNWNVYEDYIVKASEV